MTDPLTCVTELRQAIDAGVVPNALFVDAKDRLNRFAERRAEEFLATGPHEAKHHQSDWWLGAYHADALVSGLHTLPAVLKRVRKAGNLAAYEAFLVQEIEPLANLIAIAKPLVAKRGDARLPVVKTAKQLAKEATQMTCQCCGRKIFAETGVIAHHGYERPGTGWQTASCFGARELPFEVSRDALGLMIKRLIVQRQRKDERLNALQDETIPVVFTWTVRKPDPRGDRFPRVDEKHSREVTRATFEDLRFGELADVMTIRSVNSFDQIKDVAIRDTRAELRSLMEYITECEKRYARWQQTHRWDLTAKVWLAVLTENKEKVA